MLVIATDEAGYGPKLGPLVVVGTSWSVNGNDLATAFKPLAQSTKIGEYEIRIDDSKSLYKSGDSLDRLHAIVSASHHLCGIDNVTLDEILLVLAAEDIDSIRATPWLQDFSSRLLVDESATVDARSQWTRDGAQQLSTHARVVTAKKFNRFCREGRNKAELLSETTLGIVRRMIDESSNEHRRVVVFCDRHGGRRYYAGVIQHFFPEVFVQIVSESASESCYRFELDGREIEIRFTVKGDRFAPVAMSSIHAKYLRECMMDALNEYFRRLIPGLTPTAGYPQDADRFLADISNLLVTGKVSQDDLIRTR